MEIIKASGVADLLALVPTLVGFEPRRSLVCVPFVGTRTLPSALRIDLPPQRREKEARLLTHAVLGMLSRMRGVDGVAVVVYSDLTFAEERGIPYLDLARGVERGLLRAGFGIVESACVAPDGWELYDGAQHDVGRPLDEIVGSPVTAQVALLPPGEGPPVDVDPEQRARVQSLVTRGELADVDVIDLIEDALAADAWDDATAAGMLELISRPALRDVVLLQAAFGRSVGELVYDDNMLWLAMQARTGETMDELVARELAEAAETGVEVGLGAHVGDLLGGRTSLIPDRPRLGRALRVAERLVALAPHHLTAPALTVYAWNLWALGRGSAAGRTLERALDADPDYGLALLLLTMLNAGMLPEWIYAVTSGVPSGT